jgi:hypothetical protein
MPVTLYPQTSKDSTSLFHRPKCEMSPALRRELLDLAAWERGWFTGADGFREGA